MENLALYWENDDWTCSFRCGVIAGYTYGWFLSAPATLEETQSAADEFWYSEDTSTYSAPATGDEHSPPPCTRCRNPYCRKLLA